DTIALKLKLVNYDVKGKYIGYTSSSPQFRDNFIVPQKEACARFLALSPLKQERRLFEHLRIDFKNEFYNTSICGRLDSFYGWGSATGVMPSIRFPKIRAFLFKTLKQCKPGVWYSTRSLIKYLKDNHPYFLIPEKLKPDRWGKMPTRYGNFYEGKKTWARDKTVQASDSDAFERVEGRYVERFLEGIPHLLGYVDVRYDPNPYTGLRPERNTLKAFRINPHFWDVFDGKVSPPKVTIQPNFEILVESPLYPAQTLAQLAPVAESVAEDRPGGMTSVITLKLKKTRVTQTVLQDETLNVKALLTGLTGRALPQNIRIELDEWAGDTEVFTLYEGVALLESDEDLPEAGKFTFQHISPTVRMVTSPHVLLDRLERAEKVPLWVEHDGAALKRLPQKARTAFGKQIEEPKTRKPKTIVVGRETKIMLDFYPTRAAFEGFRKAMLDARCPVIADPEKMTLTFAEKYRAQAEAAAEGMGDRFVIRFREK
ncbi:MAG: hypothetical protein ACE5GO_06575, partial [Anaerolineales bacterium]